MKPIGIFCILIFVLSACTTSGPMGHTLISWQLSDIQYLEFPNTQDPASDLVAIYTRQINEDFQIRLDILDLQPDFNLNFYIFLDTSPAENSGTFPTCPSVISSAVSDQGWDWMLALPIKGDPQVFLPGKESPESGLTPRIQRDPLMDTVVLSINQNKISIPDYFVLQVFVTPADDTVVLDQSPPVSKLIAGPISPAPLLLIFSDSFPAVTPAQALRAWDGAHTGPTGERHGLLHVLTNAEKFNIPVVLLDIKSPKSLAALDLMGALPQVRDLVDQDLLLLPDLAFATPSEVSLLSSQHIASAYGLHTSPFIFSVDEQLQPDHQYQFVDLPDRSHLLRRSKKTLIPVPDRTQTNAPIQATDQGLSLEVRQQLLATAISPDPTDLVILGGSLPHSTWGDSDMSLASMAYIAAHPWIQPLNADQIKSFGTQPDLDPYVPPFSTIPSFPIFTSQGSQTLYDSTRLKARILQDLRSSSANTISDLAWQMYFSLTSPTSDPILTRLRYQYLNQVESMLFASRWLESRSTYSDCSQDIDLDSLNECVLSNPDIFAIIEPDGGRLSFLFEVVGGRIHQLVGPMSQFAVGQSDPSLWHPEKGLAADPLEIAGAFNNSDDSFMMYTISDVNDGSLILDRSDGQIKMVYQLVEKGLSLEINTNSIVTLEMPLALDPQVLFKPGWSELYYLQASTNALTWGVQGDISVEILSTAVITVQDFTESSLLLESPENPDQDYPPGHFLPFPFAVVEIAGKGQFSVDILGNK